MNSAGSATATAEWAVSSQEWDAWRSFLDMRTFLDRELERQLQRDAGLSSADYGILTTLSTAKDRRLRARELGELLAWEKSRVSHQVSRMESRGLVERQECPEDARGTWIAITPEGRRTMLRATRDHGATLRRYFLDVLEPGELEQLAHLSKRVLGVINPSACEIAESPDA
ncbi:MarR family winged helix-turn-helix transcriptional regulator [Lysobacter korlensis]|uniref:MarR family winged helix-turn-helix transcriptional regulator n=1 Tax=Lysobacter korlensis TaxID=553636 RepID=A0ABV6RTD0_9GAMM